MNTPLTPEQQVRLKAILLHREGKSQVRIASLLGKSRHWVQITLKRYEETEQLADRPRSGRPLKFSKAERSRLLRSTQGKRNRSTRAVALRFRQSSGKSISHKTVHNEFKKAGLYPHRRIRVPKLTEAQRQRRVAFTQKYQRHNWKNTLFTDEKHFPLYPSPNKKNDVVWDEASAHHEAEQVKHSPTVRVWGGISWYGTSPLIEYNGTINSKNYTDILDQTLDDIKDLFPRDNWWFLQDGASAHTSKHSIAWLCDNVPNFIPPEDWPANSPDLNPIENIWGYIEKKVHEKPCRTMRQLRRRIFDEWNKLNATFLKNYISSMTSRLTTVRENNGASIR